MTRPGPGLVAAVAAWLGLGLVAFLTIWLLRPPAPVPATAAPGEFSAERALRHVEAIARSPRAIGSASHAAARNYISEQLRAFGLEPEIQQTTETTAISSTAGPLFYAGTVRNVLARRKGVGDERAVLLVAHYDSVATGPGANDDGVGVATLLETARALGASSEPLKKDIIFLFTDSEETGLLGARAFLAEHPWAKKVEVVLNFEARGNGGPVIMFETSPQNGALIRALAEATSYPLANSLSYEVYKRLPNSTDMTVFKAAGLTGMNFGYINGLTHYHTQLDNLENIDARTVQHHGSYALALSRHFGAAISAVTPEGDAIYFDALGFMLVRYPAWLAWPFSLGVLVLFGAVVRPGFRQRELTGRGIVKGALVFFVTMIAAAAAVWCAWWIMRRIQPAYSQIAQGDSYCHGLHVLGFAALTFATVTAILGSFGRRIGASNLFVGALFWWAALMVVATAMVIGGSYLLTWPLFFALLGLGYAFRRRDQGASAWGELGVAFLCAIPGVLLVVPFVHLALIAMAFALAPALVVLLALLAGLLIPLLSASTANRWTFPGIFAALALLFFVVADMGFDFDKDHRQSNHLLYSLDVTKQSALWISFDARPDEWTKQFLGEKPKRAPLDEPFPVGRRPSLQASAPLVPVRPPEARRLEDVATNGLRRLRIHLASPRGAERISVRVNGEVTGAMVDGKRIDSKPVPGEPPKNWSMSYFAVPKEGIELTLETASPSPLLVRVVDESYGLPLLDGAAFTARPAHMMPAPFFRSDFTLVSQDYSF